MKRCRICKTPYTATRPLQPTCDSYDCKVAYALSIAGKIQAKREKTERKETKAQLSELKPLQYWLKRAQVAVNALRRAEDLRDGYGCITCDTHDAEEWHAGHWISVGASSGTRFDPANIHLQCRQCNYFGGGRAQEYEARLPARIGQAEVDRIKHAQRSYKWTREECQQIERDAKTKLKAIQNG